MGLRPGRPRLKPLAAGWAALALLAGCSGLDEQEEARLSLHRENAQSFYERGDYARALHQANMAAALDDRSLSVQLVRGYSLLKLGKNTRQLATVDEAIDIFASYAATLDGEGDFRVHLGLGSAHLAAALLSDELIEKAEQRLQSEFLSAAGRRADESALRRLVEDRQAHLAAAEAALRRTLAFELQKDNAFAIVELALTLNSMGDRDLETIALAERALALLDESTRLTRQSLDRNTRLTPSARLDLNRRLEGNAEQQRLLRDLIATIHYHRGDLQGFLAQLALLDEKNLLDEAQLWNRAAVHEDLGEYGKAAQDLERFLRLRVKRLSYEQDPLAPEVFRRIEELRARPATAGS